MTETKPQTNEQIWNWASAIMSGEGPSSRAKLQIVPVTHILSTHGSEKVMWCSGGKALEETPLRRRECPTCLRLAKDMLEDLWGDEDDYDPADAMLDRMERFTDD